MRGLLTPLPALNQGQRGQFPRGKARRGRAEQRLARPGRRAPTAPQEAEGDGWRLTVKASRPAPRAPPPRPPAPLTHPSPQHGAAPRRWGGGNNTQGESAPARLRPLRERRESGRAPPRPARPLRRLAAGGSCLAVRAQPQLISRRWGKKVARSEEEHFNAPHRPGRPNAPRPRSRRWLAAVGPR